jgi:hypothetical protein
MRWQAGMRKASSAPAIAIAMAAAPSRPRAAATALPETSAPAAAMTIRDSVDSTPDTASANAAAWWLTWRRSNSRKLNAALSPAPAMGTLTDRALPATTMPRTEARVSRWLPARSSRRCIRPRETNDSRSHA